MVGEGFPKHDPGGPVGGPLGSLSAQAGRAGGIILAGMHTWGEAALDNTICRPLLPVACRPLIWHVARWLRRGGVSDAVVCGNSDTDSIRWRLGVGAEIDLALRYYEDVMPRGPAGCMRDAGMESDTEDFVVVESAILPQIDLTELLDEHQASKSALTLVVADNRMGDRHDAMMEPVGVYIVSREALGHVPDRGYQDIKETLIPTLYAAGARVCTFRVQGEQAPRVTGAGSYLSVNMFAVERLASDMEDADDYTRWGEAWVHRTAEVSSGARLVGPVLVSAGSNIDTGSLLVGPTAVGRDSTIREDAVVSRTIVWDRCTIGSRAVVDHSIVTDDACVEADSAVRNSVCFARPRGRTPLLRRFSMRGRSNGNDHG